MPIWKGGEKQVCWTKFLPANKFLPTSIGRGLGLWSKQSLFLNKPNGKPVEQWPLNSSLIEEIRRSAVEVDTLSTITITILDLREKDDENRQCGGYNREKNYKVLREAFFTFSCFTIHRVPNIPGGDRRILPSSVFLDLPTFLKEQVGWYWIPKIGYPINLL